MKRNNLFYSIVAIIFMATTISCDERAIGISIVPEPSNLIINRGGFTLSDGYNVVSTKETKSISDYIENEIEKNYNISPSSDIDKTITLELVDKMILNKKEGYQLEVNSNNITIRSVSPEGIFYGVQSLLQLIFQAELNSNQTIKIANCTVEDAPRFEWRGFMLDESRHFFGMDKVKTVLDMMAFHKLNIFHWHLTDSDGWRVEIKRYPLLTEIGGVGNYSKTTKEACYYTQEQIKEIIAYANARYITIIPEIDMPGHASAAVRAYPEHSGGGSEKHPDFTFNPGSEEAYSFLKDILTEISELFPSKWIHIGVDEVHFGNEEWNNLPEVKELMKNNQLNDLKDVEKYFSHRIAKIIKDLGKVTTGWDEIVEHHLPTDNSLVMWWRHDKPKVLKEALKSGYNTIVCPRVPYYLDFIQDSTNVNGRRWEGEFSELHTVYNYSPVPNDITDAERDLIKGIQTNLWTERFITGEQLDYATYPRVTAISESAWSTPENRDYENFKIKLKWIYKYYSHRGDIEAYYNILDPTITPEPKR